MKHVVAIEDESEINILFEYNSLHAVRTKSAYKHLPRQCKLHLALLEGNRVVYTHSQADRKKIDGAHYYDLKISSFDGEVVQMISYEYERVPFEKDYIKNFAERIKRSRSDQVVTGEKVEKYLKKYPYYPTLKNVLVDRGLIFAFTFKKNSKGDYLADIFDIDSGSYERSAYFSVVPNLIKDGLAYYLRSSQDILPKVEVYKVSNKVYEK